MKEKNKLLYIILTMIILILIAVNIKLFINNQFNVSQNENEVSDNKILNQNINTNYNTVSAEEDEENRTNKIATLTERQRMQTYFGTYISYVENEKYQEAYNLLYDGFKQNYFPSIENFTNYVQNNYPSNIVVEYTNIERQGTIFILTVKIRDALNDSTQTEVQENRVVVMENATNDFKLSFEVIEQ